MGGRMEYTEAIIIIDRVYTYHCFFGLRQASVKLFGANLDGIPGRRQNLMKVEACLKYDAIAALFLDNTKARHPSFCDDIDLRHTRIDRQAGGVYLPSFRHDAVIPEQPELHRIDEIRSIAPPGSAVLERTTHVQELHSFRRLERFLFKHGAACRIDSFSPPDLWPDDGWPLGNLRPAQRGHHTVAGQL